jgi:hypothetical protein
LTDSFFGRAGGTETQIRFLDVIARFALPMAYDAKLRGRRRARLWIGPGVSSAGWNF